MRYVSAKTNQLKQSGLPAEAKFYAFDTKLRELFEEYMERSCARMFLKMYIPLSVLYERETNERQSERDSFHLSLPNAGVQSVTKDAKKLFQDLSAFAKSTTSL